MHFIIKWNYALKMNGTFYEMNEKTLSMLNEERKSLMTLKFRPYIR